MILNGHSFYSLRYGTLSIEEVVREAIEKNYECIALTDINNTAGVLSFVKLCREHQIKPIVGAEFRNGNELLFVAIARNNEGFREINEALTKSNQLGLPYPATPDFENCYVIYPYHKNNLPLKEHEYIGIRLTDLNKIIVEKKSLQQKYVILQSSTYKDKAGYLIHKKFRAIDLNLLFDQLQPEHMAGIDAYILPRKKLLDYFERFPHIIENTKRLCNDCSFEYDFKKPKNKKTFTGDPAADKELLESETLKGFALRYPKGSRLALERVHTELEIINKMGFCPYFLITWDITKFSWERQYYHYGRGSGANSIVAYCLRITDVDPIEHDLYFERFLNPKRNSPPDFDIDYSWKDRNAVYDYIFKTYKKEHTALLGAMVTFQDRSIIREMGKIHGLPKDDIERMIRYPNSPLNDNDICKEILQQSKKISDYPSIRSIHAGGVIITELPLTCYTALDMPPKGYATTQFDMHTAEVSGLDKLDILSQRGLGHIKEARDLILKNQGITVDIHQVEKFKTDEASNKLLESGNTTGCFYIESPAMRQLIRKLKCNNYLTLVAASSVIRPGVAKSGMMTAYIERHRKLKPFEYLHPIMEEQLHETHGVMVYQEDVLKIAHHYGGLDFADADVLRRMMSGKARDEKQFMEIERKFFEHCHEKKYNTNTSKLIWKQIESFAGYSFAKGHSASYAGESYQSLYLKAHYPLEFIVAVINNFGGFYATRVYVNEAKKLGGIVHLPCVNKSDYTTTLFGKNIYLGFIHIKSLNEDISKKIKIERETNGNYNSLDNFKLRTGLSLEQLIILIRIDALRFTGQDKRELLWEAHMLYNPNEKKRKDISLSMFSEPVLKWKLPKLEKNKIEDAYDELELLEFPVSLNEFDLLKTTSRGDCKSTELINYVGKTVRIMGNFVTQKSVRTSNKNLMAFGTFFDHEGEFFDTTHFSESLKAYPFRGWGVYLILGKVVEDFGVPSVEVHKMAKLDIETDKRFN
ncbi:MAG: polymerase subunit alpha [Bacteroidota bacterium]|jgi:DNA polymerase-3 subunit alpha|nr:polymerase subunit alpha [Bacteroidota bacterium]